MTSRAHSSSSLKPSVCRFDRHVPANGYAWWYVDAISDDGAYGLTIIAFIGSVFSPYYAWSGRADPANHCAVNIALYGPRHARWAMTERGRAALSRGPDFLRVGPSQLSWHDDALHIEVDEFAAWLPQRLRGRITVHAETLNREVFDIGGTGHHAWQPIAPTARITVDMDAPHLNWQGEGYFDCNEGSEALEDRFAVWDWSRGRSGPNETTILYNSDLRSGAAQQLALKFRADGAIEHLAPPAPIRLPETPVFRIPRRTRGDADTAPRVIKTLEDTPFYARSVIESRVFGSTFRAVHETYIGQRFRAPVVKAMLPFRMPRVAR